MYVFAKTKNYANNYLIFYYRTGNSNNFTNIQQIIDLLKSIFEPKNEKVLARLQLNKKVIRHT